jgi:methylmalonyl-CoA mutase C-terminal domain/subunit
MREKMDKIIRVLIAKPGLDGHQRGAFVIARALRDAGMEVIYTGIRQSPAAIVNVAEQEGVDIIGLSILSGAHMTLCQDIMTLLNKKDLQDLPVVVGGTIPREDATALKKFGVIRVFGPGSSVPEIVEFIKKQVHFRSD